MAVLDRANRLFRRLPTGVVYTAAMLPVLWLIWQTLNGDLGPDPVKTMERSLGEWALRFLLASLAITPLRRAGLNLLRFRRALGLMAFAYAALHLTVWIWPDMGLRWAQITADVFKRPYILLGMGGFLAMLPLALTSSNTAIRKMGGRSWTRLHRLAYAALAFGSLHMVLQAKLWGYEVVIYAGLAVLLLALRLRKPAGRSRTATAQP
ncbi:MAG: protein-methionine-sulfoxide reductase heme-binding subunit MsrQ [Paracoccaceae bacterium]